jgi:hypothetical protein
MVQQAYRRFSNVICVSLNYFLLVGLTISVTIPRAAPAQRRVLVSAMRIMA